MKAFAGLLALGFLCLAVPHDAHAALSCVTLRPASGIYKCTESDQYPGEEQYFWSSNPPGGVTQLGHMRLLFEQYGLDYDAYVLAHQADFTKWVAFYACAFNGDPDHALPVETVSVEIEIGPGDHPVHTASIPCGQDLQAYNEEISLWYQWEFNVMYFWALITGGQGQMPNFCYFWGTPFSCIDGTEWDAYGVTMFMMGWYNTYFW